MERHDYQRPEVISYTEGEETIINLVFDDKAQNVIDECECSIIILEYTTLFPSFHNHLIATQRTRSF